MKTFKNRTINSYNTCANSISSKPVTAVYDTKIYLFDLNFQSRHRDWDGNSDISYQVLNANVNENSFMS